MGLALNDYRRALDVLFARTTGGSKLGLERTEALLAALGNPHHALRAYHIAGTNGKGSVAASLEALLRSDGRRVGKYTSPHLVDFRERIVVERMPIAAEAVVDFVERWLPTIEATGATFFEATTVMAFDWFARMGVDATVIETGLGGRLDATNVLRPVVAGVTSIGFDHMEYLGDTLESIAGEKAGIFKRGVPAVIGEPAADVRELLAERARAAGATPVAVLTADAEITDVSVSPGGTSFVLRRGGRSQSIRTPLIGRHQAWNASVALLMYELGGGSSTGSAATALDAVALSGRFETVGKFIFDVAHNTPGVEVLVQTLRTVEPARPLVAVVCILGDKEWQAMLSTLAPHVDRLILTDAPTAPASRAWTLEAVGDYAAARQWPADLVPDFDAALQRAELLGATVLVTGSFHTVGDAIARLQAAPTAF